MAEPLHILIVIDNFRPLVGGAEQAALGSARGLAARGHRVDVLTLRKQPDWPAEERLGDVRVFRFPERIPPRPFGRFLYGRANAAAARRYADEHLASAPYDAILLHPIDAAVGVARSQVASRAALVTCFHAPLGEEHRRQARGLLDAQACPLCKAATCLTAAYTARRRTARQRAKLRRSHAATCPSDYSRQLLFELAPWMRGGLVEVVPWGVDAETFRPPADRAALRAGLGWGSDELVVFTARRLVPRMGLGGLVEGVALAGRKRPGIRLAVAGDGPLRGSLEAQARKAGARADFLGLVPAAELIRCYQAADLFVLPSLDLEAFGLVVLEALACGTPVLATDRCAPPEILRPLDERLLIPSAGPEAIADALLGQGSELASDPRFRQRCRAYVVERYSWARTAAALEDVIRRALERGGGRAGPRRGKPQPAAESRRRSHAEEAEEAEDAEKMKR